MAIILSKSIFIHVPKTGGTWITEALQAAGLTKTVTKRGTKHASLHEVTPLHRKVKFHTLIPFMFVRNPVTWWQSRWGDPYHRDSFLKKHNPSTIKWCGNIKWMNCETMIETQEQFDNFNKYIEHVLDKRPGFVTEYYRFMTNCKKAEIGKYENIVLDLIELLYRMGEEFDVDKIKNVPRINESDRTLNRLYKKENLANLIEAEKKIMEQYNYSTNINDYLHLIKK